MRSGGWFELSIVSRVSTMTGSEASSIASGHLGEPRSTKHLVLQNSKKLSSLPLLKTSCNKKIKQIFKIAIN